MTTRALVDPEILHVLDMFPSMSMSLDVLPMARAGFLEMFNAAAEPAASGVTRSEHHVPGPFGGPDVRVLVYTPESRSDGVSAGPSTDRAAFFHIHGGGYIIGLPELNDARNRGLAEQLDMVVVSVDYRLAPETPHPGPVDDCYAALCWLVGQASRLGVDASRIAVGGESAGGGLAAALCLLARDQAEVRIAFQLLIYPMLDDRTGSSAPHDPLTGEFMWTAASNRFGWRSLLGREPGGDDTPPYAAAARAPDLAGLPPTFLAVGALDLFRDENIAYASRLLHAGVPTELHVYPGAFHGFDMAPEAAVSKTLLRDYTQALGKGLRPKL